MATTTATASPTTVPAAIVEYLGVERLPDGKWRSSIINQDGLSVDVGEFKTAMAAALAHDRAILAILGPNTSATVLNFRCAFSDIELRFLHGHHAVARPAGIVSMLRVSGDDSYDTTLTRFAAHAFDTYMDPELALDVASFRLAHGDMLLRIKEEVAIIAGNNANQAARAKAELDAERQAFMEVAKNKATNSPWVERYHRRQREIGWTFEDENRWPLMLPYPCRLVPWGRVDLHTSW
ncbi:hypothetical protein BS78_01G243100 [Paspalum vaginatum]|nr:hypothetical protein BS78_01G243100 [Paspalum vaginatum]